jgi:hypothetical protein
MSMSNNDLQERQRRLRQVVGRGAPAADDVVAPTHWPSLGPLKAEHAWPELRAWVTALRERYEELDYHVIPACWYEHPAHVAALQALKDHERVAYDKTAPGSSGTDWHRAYRDMVILLRTFTGHLQCTTAAHQPSRPVPGTDEAAWEKFVADDVARRRRRATTAALGQSEQ